MKAVADALGVARSNLAEQAKQRPPKRVGRPPLPEEELVAEIKAVIADAYGMPFDNFQRVHADPASVTVISYTSAGPHVLCVNTTAGDLSWLAAGTQKDTSQDAPQVGGGAGH